MPPFLICHDKSVGDNTYYYSSTLLLSLKEKEVTENDFPPVSEADLCCCVPEHLKLTDNLILIIFLSFSSPFSVLVSVFTLVCIVFSKRGCISHQPPPIHIHNNTKGLGKPLTLTSNLNP